VCNWLTKIWPSIGSEIFVKQLHTDPVLLLLTSLAAYFVVRAGLRQHRSSQHWTEKFTTYSKLIKALQANVFYYNRCFQSQTNDDIPYPEPSSVAQEDEVIRTLTLAAGWTVSERTVKLIMDHSRRPRRGGRYDPPYEFYDSMEQYYRNLVAEIIQEANIDLGLKHNRWPRIAAWMRTNLPVDWA
jgi:hypothetical protein